MLFGSSGIRKRFDKDLIQIALAAGSAVASDSKKIIAGKDTRTTGDVLFDAFISGCLSNGANVRDAGIVPTPVTAFGTRFNDAGCMVTASHNPEEYNGLKLFNPDGSSFTRSQQETLEKSLKKVTNGDWLHQGTVVATDAVTPYRNAVLGSVSLDNTIKVVLDCAGGAGSAVSPGLLSDLGAEVVCINCHKSGHFPHAPEPVEDNLHDIASFMKKYDADIAIVHDGDADRMVAFDEKRRYIDGDHLLMLFVSYLGAKRVVTTADTTMAVEEIAETRRTPVGDSFVSEALRTWGEFGGEPSGAWIFPAHSLCPDGPYAAALFCEIAGEWNVADAIDEMPCYPLLRESEYCEHAEMLMRSLGAATPTEGIRLTFEDGWCLIRASGTEPKIRFTAEGTTPRRASEIMSLGREMVRKGKTH